MVPKGRVWSAQRPRFISRANASVWRWRLEWEKVRSSRKRVSRAEFGTLEKIRKDSENVAAMWCERYEALTQYGFYHAGSLDIDGFEQ